MSDTTWAMACATAIVATGAALGVHPAAVVTAGLGAGVGLVFVTGLGRGPALTLSGLMTLLAPLGSAWIVAERGPFAAPLAAQCVIAGLISCGTLVLAPTMLRAVVEHTPAVVRAVAERLVRIVGGK